MQRSKSVYENKTKSKSWFHGPFLTLFSNNHPAKRREIKRPNSWIEDFSLRPKIYRAFSKVTRKQSKASSLETAIEHVSPSVLKEDREEEADRIQLKNDLVKLAFEGEFSLPFDYKDLSSGRILDVGCGPGSWCIDLAQTYPHIQVFGVDHVDMFPSEYMLPANCHLLVSDVLQGLSDFPDASFDVIHIRFMILALTTQQYLQVAQDCWRLLKPGGYLEILETDLTVYSAGPLTQSMNRKLIDIAISKGFDTREQPQTLDRIVPAEGINRQMKYRSIPIGVWGGRIGVLCRDDTINILTKFQAYHTQESQSFEQAMAAVVKEMDQYKSFSNYYFSSAQKPF